MHLLEFPDSNIKRYIPAELSECNSWQYIYICDLFLKYQSQLISKDSFLIDATYKLLDMVPSKKKKKNPDNTNLILIAELLENSFFEKIENPEKPEEYQLKIKQNYINNPVESYKPLWRRYFGPSDGFMNVKFGEYRDALRLFLEFNKTGEIELLYELAATLYRPKKRFIFIEKLQNNYDGDVRQKYNSYQIKERISVFKKGPIGFVYGVYLYFASMQLFVSSAEVPWGDKTLDFSILFSQQGEKEDIGADDIGLDAVVFVMAESGVFGNLEKVDQTSFWTIMIKMYDARVKELQLLKQQENATSQQG